MAKTDCIGQKGVLGVLYPVLQGYVMFRFRARMHAACSLSLLKCNFVLPAQGSKQEYVAVLTCKEIPHVLLRSSLICPRISL